MTNEEAKFIMQAYRPNGADALDVTFKASLEQSKRDASLGKWLEVQQAFDMAVAAKFRTIEPPAELRARILTGAHVSRPSARIWWRQPKWLA